MKTDSEKVDFIYQYILAQNQPVSAAPKQDFQLPFEVYHEDLTPMTYINAVEAVKKLGDWRIPSVEEMKLMCEKKDIIGGFTTDYPGWYWSSTELRSGPDCVHIVHFSEGSVGGAYKDVSRFPCRPIRSIK